MTWTCVLRDKAPERPSVGDMWFYPEHPENFLSDEYGRERKGSRPPLMVCLPGSVIFCVDSCYLPEGKPLPKGAPRPGWNVSGEPPRITVHPSINVVGRYHGWISDGVIMDDVDGRKF